MAKSLEQRVAVPTLAICRMVPAIAIGSAIGGCQKGGCVPKLYYAILLRKRLPTTVVNEPKRGFPVPTISGLVKVLRERNHLVPGAGLFTIG